MPNLLVASGIFHPESGGPATYLQEILPALQSRGWDLRVLSYGDSRRSDYPYPVVRAARRVYPLRLAQYGLLARKNLAWADVIYLQSTDLPLWGMGHIPRVIKIVGDPAWERCIRRGWTAPDVNIDDFQTMKGDWRVRWQRGSRSRQVKAMDAVVVPGEYLKRMAMGWGIDEGKVHVIYNALREPPGFAKPRAEMRADLGWDDRPTLLTAARLHPWKGIDYLIEALRSMPDVRLIVVGDGPDLGRLQGLAQALGDRVRWMGHLPRADVHRLMAAADAVILYSGYEGLSHTLLESLQLGTPVLASDKGGNPEVVQHGVNGLLVPYADAAALRRGIRQLLARRDELAANAQTGLERFAFRTMVQRTDALLRSLLRQRVQRLTKR